MGIALFGFATIVAVSGIAGWLYYRRSGHEVEEVTEETQARDAASLEVSWPPAAVMANAATGDNAALDQARPVVRALLKNLAESVASLDVNSAQYGDALDKHRAGIQKASTLAGIQEIERVLLTELDHMQGANTLYRQQLEQANVKLRQQQQQLDRLQVDTGTDFLTKVANRRAFDARFREEFSRATRYEQPFSLILIDIDLFKQVNDGYGHLTGDRILKAIARLLDERRRENDLLARYGGEEFVLLLPDTPAHAARAVAEDLRTRVERTVFRCDELALHITISLGVGEVQPATDTEKSLFARVDTALYQAKGEGRNRVVVAEAPEAVTNGPEVGRADSVDRIGKQLFRRK